MPRIRVLAAVAAVFVVLAGLASPLLAAPEGVRVVEAWPGQKFDNPVGIVSGPSPSSPMYVLEQVGRIRAMAIPRTGTPASPPTTFLDLTAKVASEGQGGVLGLAFHPRYAENRRLFVCYLGRTGRDPDKFRIVLSEFVADGIADGVADGIADGAADGARAAPGSEKLMLEIPKSTAHHNGGGLLFGPDGMLYLSTGDNRIQKQAVNTSQNPASLLGKILRIDVNDPPPGSRYGIPKDNPWATAGPGVRPEIWAYGFRNPYRFGFDAEGALWTCEPGTKGECRESVDKVVRGGNHGWPFFEGTRPMEPIPERLRGARFVPPVFEYVRTGGEGMTAAVGGIVYRGRAIPSLRGLYVFGDYGRGIVMALDMAQQPPALHVLGKVDTFSSLGEDARGELYATSHETGKVYAIR